LGDNDITTMKLRRGTLKRLNAIPALTRRETLDETLNRVLDFWERHQKRGKS
jgi:hypothetical protein